MVTKTGKRHYTCTFSTYHKDGTLLYRCLNNTFTTANVKEYIRKSVESYAAHGIRAEYTDLIDLDA